MRTVTNPAHIGIGEDLVLVPVDQVADLVDVGRGKTVGIGLVVGQLGVNVVVDIPLFKRCQSDKGSGCFGQREDSRCFLR